MTSLLLYDDNNGLVSEVIVTDTVSIGANEYPISVFGVRIYCDVLLIVCCVCGTVLQYS